MYRASHLSSVVRNAVLASCLLLVGVATSALAQGPAPSCEISGPTKVFVGEPFTLCAIEGAGLTYSWYDANEVLLTNDRCLDFPSGLPAAGFYDFEMDISQGPDYLKCPFTIEVNERPDDPKCEIDVRLSCDSAELCGPEGFDYLWSGPGVDGATTRCVTVTESGTYSLTITDPATKTEATCETKVEIAKDCAENCPRTPGFWMQQVAQRDNGSTKFTRAQVTAIAECISDAVDVFNWGTGDDAFNAFKATITPPKPMNCEKVIKMHFASLLANVCATGVPTLNGEIVTLDTSTEVTCNGSTRTIAQLIAAVDAELTSASPDYCKYIDCVDNINNGIGIPVSEDCRAQNMKEDASQRLGSSPLGGTFAAPELSFSASNPASFTSVLRFSLPAEGDVSIKIFDIAGRQVADLGVGFKPAGSHVAEWNVRSVARGLYFARLSWGAEVRTQQIVVTH